MKFNKHYIKKFITLIVLLVIPLSLFMLYIYNNVLKIYTDQEAQQNERMIQQMLSRAEENMNQLENLMLQISYESNLMQDENTSRDEDSIIEQLMKYKLMNPLIHEIVLYYRGEDILYTSQYATQLKSFINHYYPYRSWDSNDFYNEMNMVTKYHIKNKEIKDDEEYDDFLTLIYPLTDTSSVTYGTLIVLVEESKLYKIIEKNLDTESNIFILDEQGQLISTLYKEKYLTNYNYLNIINHLLNKQGKEITIDKKKKFIMSAFSEDINWRVVILGSYNNLINNIQKHFLNWAGTFLCILISLLAVVAYLSERHHHSMQSLYDHIKQYLPDNSPFTGENADVLLEAFHGLHRQNQALTVENSTLKKKDSLYALLTTKLDTSQVTTLLAELGIQLTCERNGVAILQSYDRNIENEMNSYLKESVRSFNGYLFKSFIPFQYILIYESSEDIKVIQDELNIMVNFYNGLEFIGLGKNHKKPTRLFKSYREALNALLYFEYSNKKVVYFHDVLSEGRVATYYPNAMITNLVQTIKSGQEKETIGYLSELLSYVKRHQTPQSMIRSMIFHLLNQLYDQEESIYPGSKVQKLLTNSLRNNEDLWSTFSSVAILLCNACHKQRNTVDLVEQMKSYIQANISNPNFSISMMSEYYAVSFSYTSRYFKDKLGITPQEFLQQCRMQEAQNLLVTTDMTLKNIAEHVGYYNVSSFIRIFKKYTKKTPGQYRAGQAIKQ